MPEERKHWFKDLPPTQKKVVIGFFVIAFVTPIIIIDPFTKKVNPCTCSEFPGKVALIGYDNLSSEDKKTFDACEKQYKTTTDAMNACIEKAKKK